MSLQRAESSNAVPTRQWTRRELVPVAAAAIGVGMFAKFLSTLNGKQVKNDASTPRVSPEIEAEAKKCAPKLADDIFCSAHIGDLLRYRPESKPDNVWRWQWSKQRRASLITAVEENRASLLRESMDAFLVHPWVASQKQLSSAGVQSWMRATMDDVLVQFVLSSTMPA